MTLRQARDRVQARVTASDDEIRHWVLPAPPVQATLRERKTIETLIGGGDRQD
jgi:hypothetical protein